MLGVDDLGAGTGIGRAEHVDQLVRAGAADDVLRIEAVAFANRPAQLPAAAVGVAVQVPGQLLEGLGSLGTRSEGALVGG